MSETAVDYNRFRVTRNHDDIGHGQIIAPHPETVSIGGLVTFDLTGDVTLGDHVEIAPGAQIFTHKHHWNHSHELRAKIQTITVHPLTIGEDVFIGVNAIILGGVGRIGRGAIIGAGAVVTKPVPEFEVWAGNPARKIGMRGENKRRPSVHLKDAIKYVDPKVWGGE
jgi:acetyltransferase-like isoleucine patch superfamily enzyme